jgi:hypothetical protein
MSRVFYSSSFYRFVITILTPCSILYLNGWNSTSEWRANLYRGNDEGLWDDCGLGMIKLNYKRSHQHHHLSDANIFEALCMPMLCMRAEASSTSPSLHPGNRPEILLRTQVILEHEYKREKIS